MALPFRPKQGDKKDKPSVDKKVVDNATTAKKELPNNTDKKETVKKPLFGGTKATEKPDELGKVVKKEDSIKEQKVKPTKVKKTKLEFYNSLSNAGKAEYERQELEKKKLVFGSVILVILLAIIAVGYFFLKASLGETLTENEALQQKANELETKINSKAETERLLENVAISGLMSKVIYENRDEVPYMLASLEALTPNTLDIVINKAQRLTKDTYKIDFEFFPTGKDPDNINKAIVETAYFVESLLRSREVIDITGRLENPLEIVDFKGTTYSKSTQSFPMSITLKLLPKGSKIEAPVRTQTTLD